MAGAYADMLALSRTRIPPKNGLDPHGFSSALSNVALTAIVIGESCTYRIAGEELRERYAQKLVGKNYYDIVPPERREHAMRGMELVIQTPCGFRAELVQEFADGQRSLAEVCAFPLGSDEPGVDGFVLFANQDIKAPPRSAHRTEMVRSVLIKRDLIDLGFGIDEGFVDLVPEEFVD